MLGNGLGFLLAVGHIQRRRQQQLRKRADGCVKRGTEKVVSTTVRTWGKRKASNREEKVDSAL